ncbi:uncharacterized protein MONOS_3233 [Monocercomonoides exilis]|uniref:uncharacterized protein n=1 Tax=Monocercomonoides exilis TaxID=2049356 RepID=UPI003559FBD3|nr:hypothetical protein MONOS_3233 [Monocercomonoides exilis]|eukprot:MONOS_3233.1-p1 / transcript=MONOS_3233.1 / gene=MONOS_3233 / organism=Monocercomonoides_exilis_PA203 / gene_product=unspecified product / transcript_product=unspecified product / location=Mono_scaffold00074:112440-112814(-) / protein_length=125 / sequence_SO=supercontig / SO=protein_coding / is_pseudo=false
MCQAVLRGGVVCAYDVALLEMLSVPLIALLPSLAASVNTKSGSKRIFAAADVIAFPSIYDLFDPSLLPSAIARLVSRSPQLRRVEMKFENKVINVQSWRNCGEGIGGRGRMRMEDVFCHLQRLS